MFHFGISYDERYKKDDLWELLRLIGRYIHRQALEGAGAGIRLRASSAFLARRNPDVAFDALGISNVVQRRYCASTTSSREFKWLARRRIKWIVPTA